MASSMVVEMVPLKGGIGGIVHPSPNWQVFIPLIYHLGIFQPLNFGGVVVSTLSLLQVNALAPATPPPRDVSNDSSVPPIPDERTPAKVRNVVVLFLVGSGSGKRYNDLIHFNTIYRFCDPKKVGIGR